MIPVEILVWVYARRKEVKMVLLDNYMRRFNGQRFTVLGRCSEGWDEECLPAWRIRLECGEEVEALPNEICVLGN